jgi:FixJ family two-component response regulator
MIECVTLLRMKTELSPRLLAILDDDRSIQCSLQDLVEAEGLSALCFSSAEQFLHFGARQKVGCLIADLHMPGMSGIELQAKLKSEQCRIPIIFLTGQGDIQSAVSAMKCGALEFFTKPVDGTRLVKAIQGALQRDNLSRLEATEHAKLVARYELLTPREREVMHLLVTGLLNKQAAFELGITEYTVQFHRGHIMRKMEADSFATLVRHADKIRRHITRRPELEVLASPRID